MDRHPVFFDFGGTLCKSRADILPAFQEAAKRANTQLPWGAYLRANEECWEELWPQAPSLVGKTPAFADLVHTMALRKIGYKGDTELLVRMIREVALSPEWHTPFPETEGTLRMLHDEGVPAHIISGHVDYLPIIVSNLGWSDLFETVTFTQEVGYQKPDLRVFEFALGRAGVDAHEAIFVGDSWESDYLGAKRAGMISVWLNRTRGVPPAPCVQVQSLDAVPALASDLEGRT